MNQKNLKKGEMNDEKKNHGTGNGGIYFRSLRMLGGKRNPGGKSDGGTGKRIDRELFLERQHPRGGGADSEDHRRDTL